MTTNIDHVKYISAWMKNLCTLVMWGVPLFLILIWLNYEAALELGFFHRIAYPMDVPSLASRIGGFLVSSVLGALVIMAIFHLRKFFTLSSEGQMFTLSGASAFHRFAKYIVVYSLLTIPFETLLGVIMTINNPVGERLISISFQPYDFTLIFLSFVLLSISWVLKESVLIAEENAQIV